MKQLLKAAIEKHTLTFKTPAKTSRNTLQEKTLWLLKLSHPLKPDVKGIGECSPLTGLSIDDVPGFEAKLYEVAGLINNEHPLEELQLEKWPAINFGLETALQDLQNGGYRKIFNSPFFNEGAKIPINGLVWMADAENMLQQAEDKIGKGFSCIKFKIGALDFDQECRMLEALRKKHSAWNVEIRLDANGAFAPDTALEQLKELSRFEVHSLEQPIKTGQWDAMQEICVKSKIAIALDEELIGHSPYTEGETLLKHIRPQYIILKPGLLGGFKNTAHWISLAEKQERGWWITSALESNIGLNAICQFTAQYDIQIPQGLGTGQLYTNNFGSPLTVHSGFIHFDKTKMWQDI